MTTTKQMIPREFEPMSLLAKSNDKNCATLGKILHNPLFTWGRIEPINVEQSAVTAPAAIMYLHKEKQMENNLIHFSKEKITTCTTSFNHSCKLTMPIASHCLQMRRRWGCLDPFHNKVLDQQWQQKPACIMHNKLTMQRLYPMANLVEGSSPENIKMWT